MLSFLRRNEFLQIFFCYFISFYNYNIDKIIKAATRARPIKKGGDTPEKVGSKIISDIKNSFISVGFINRVERNQRGYKKEEN